ncbi:hypothetical protein [Nitrosospira multiformis]|uniref:Uncharacterized protein n=1 Tax=Nitrosospira multiformis TaxID=1231 RepID=A0A1I7FTI6_9PROT|nr:hypothetical protein [Nitrosospira multiformis]SFU39495.1 hypothetical protein SAMN05216417_102205 [Nitrosospira multiformis]
MRTTDKNRDTPGLFTASRSLSAEAVLQQIKESLYDLNPPGEALYVQLYQALADEHQRAIDSKQQDMADLLRDLVTNAHLILSLGYPDNPPSHLPGSGSPQTIRALMHRRDDQE